MVARRVSNDTVMTSSSRNYVVLGDSVSIDDYAGGKGQGAASLLFVNNDERFPDWRGRDLLSTGLADILVLLPRDGATSSDVVGRQMPLLGDLGVAPVAVTISMGGNDLLAVFSDTRAAATEVGALRVNADIVLSGLRRLVGPQVPIALATVYDPSDGSGDASAVGLKPWPEVTELLGELNEVLRAVAMAYDVSVAEVHQRFLGHGLSVGDPSQMEVKPVNRSLWYCGVVEPNAWGASEIRAAYCQALDGLR
jgi:lysophospholipase L1-like esterase